MGDFEPTLAGLLQRAMNCQAPHAADTEAAARLVGQDRVTEAFRRIGVDLTAAAGERLHLFRSASVLCRARLLDVAGHDVSVRLPQEELWRYYLPICQALVRMRPRNGRRLLVGITGPGASGKSVFAILLRDVFNAAFGCAEGSAGGAANRRQVAADAPCRAAICPMDGFHYPNSYLGSHFITDEQGRRVALRAFKGSPPSFDAKSFVRCLRALKAEASVAVPRYDRVLHDPVPGGILIGLSDGIVLVEGNYVLLDEGPWAAVGELIDFSLFLIQPLDAVLDAMVKRHVRGGRSEQDAVEYVARVDRRNYEICMSTAVRADLVVRRDADQRIVALEAGRRHIYTNASSDG
jgi:pantothenate kinase